MHSDAFGTGLLDPVAAAAYLDQHPGGTIPRPSASSGTVAPDAIVAGYVGADHKIELTTASGGKIPVAGVQSGQPAARIAFSRDGAWFSAADGTNLAIVNVQSRRQETVTCACRGVAFNDKGQLLTADGDVIATYEPATAGRLHGVRVRNPGAGLPSVMPLTVEGSGGGVTVVGAQFASAGYGAFGVRPDGTMFLIGQGPDPGVDRIVMSDDGRWVAWSIQAACLRRSQMGIADLSRPGTAAYVTGPTADGEALQIHFDGNNVVAGWAPLQHTSSGCGEPPWPPAQWQLARPAMGTGTAYEPATAQWSRAGDPRIVLHRWPSGEGLYLQPTKTIHAVRAGVRARARRRGPASARFAGDRRRRPAGRLEPDAARKRPPRQRRPRQRRPRQRRRSRRDRRPQSMRRSRATRSSCTRSAPATSPRSARSPAPG